MEKTLSKHDEECLRLQEEWLKTNEPKRFRDADDVYEAPRTTAKPTEYYKGGIDFGFLIKESRLEVVR